jgi:uncharacterized protein (TIGR00369 family)
MTNNINKRMQAMFESLSKQANGQFPPKVFDIMEGEFIELGSDFIEMSFPIKTDFDNPFHITFGGMFGMWLDGVFGPFSGIVVMAPTVSLDLNITYIQPVSVKDKTVVAKAQVVNKSKTFLNLEGQILKTDGTLCATGTSRMMILDPKRMK